jgi:hypothetical protein
MLLIPELSVSPATVLLSRVSPGVSQTASTAPSAAPPQCDYACPLGTTSCRRSWVNLRIAKGCAPIPTAAVPLPPSASRMSPKTSKMQISAEPVGSSSSPTPPRARPTRGAGDLVSGRQQARDERPADGSACSGDEGPHAAPAGRRERSITPSRMVVRTSDTRFAGPSQPGPASPTSIRWLSECRAYCTKARAKHRDPPRLPAQGHQRDGAECEIPGRDVGHVVVVARAVGTDRLVKEPRCEPKQQSEHQLTEGEGEQ